MTTYALLIGVKEVDPTAYNNWNGKNGCEGCEIDVATMQGILAKKSFDPKNITPLLTQNATRKNVLDALNKAAAICKPGDLFVFYYSGHGGQVKDVNGDEEDGQDETLVCYDGEVIDDQLNDAWKKFPEGARIVAITDCCNSQSNFRAIPRGPVATFQPKSLTSKLVDADEMKAMMIHIGACLDGKTAQGYKDGGLFTKTLKKILDQQFLGTYRMLVDTILKRTNEHEQVASYTEYGPTESQAFSRFRSGKIFTAAPMPSLRSTARSTVFGTERAPSNISAVKRRATETLPPNDDAIAKRTRFAGRTS